jgi:hypothetical protein
MFDNLAKQFPPLYECSVCGNAVTVTPQGEGVEPIKEFSCPHTTAIIYANRKVVLYGKGQITVAGRIRLTIRQLLSHLLKRSV